MQREFHALCYQSFIFTHRSSKRTWKIANQNVYKISTQNTSTKGDDDDGEYVEIIKQKFNYSKVNAIKTPQ
jgi:hypothetical protein